MATPQLHTRHVILKPCVHPIDLTAGPLTGDYTHMKYYDAVLVSCYMGTMTQPETITVEQCTQDADAGGDAKAIGTGKTITAVSNSIVSVDVTAPELDVDGGFEWLKVTTSVNVGQAALGCVFVAAYRFRFAEEPMIDPMV